MELNTTSQDGLNFTIKLEGVDDRMRKGSNYKGIVQTSPTKAFKGAVMFVGTQRVSWKKVVRGLRDSPFRTRIGENDWKVARSLGYFPLNLDIDTDLHPEFRFKDLDGVMQMLKDAMGKTLALKKWWEFWQ